MGICVLGSLQTSGARLSPRERTALSVLALRSPAPVHPDELADALWGEHLPDTWSKQVQVCVSRIRSKLPQGSIATSPGGYRLADCGPDSLDVRAFESAVSQARDLLIAAEADRAATAFSRALALWRGTAYEELADWDGSHSERARLTEQRQQVQEEWLEARLAAGEHRSVVADARGLLAEEPLRERRWGILALAQYREGRQGDALSTLRRARRVLSEELGVDPGRDLLELEQSMRIQDPSLDGPDPSPTISTECPYQGLAPFASRDQETYFGRKEEVQRCVAHLRTTGHLVLTGASGSGKTSLLRAGIMPALARSGVSPLYVVPAADPLRTLYAALATADAGSPLVVDQLEELFLLEHPPEVVLEFCGRLAAEARSRPLALGIRVDQLGELGIDPGLGELVEKGLHLVRPLDEEQLREVIERPAAAAGLRLQAGLTDLLLRDAADGAGTLPLLSHTLVETWKHREGGVLTVAGYRATGGISGAVARTADRLYEDLSERDRAVCRSVLLHLVELPDAGAAVCRRLPRTALQGDTAREGVVAQLVRARLLTLQEDSVEIAHEALVRAWPRLRSWLDDDADGIRTLRHLALAAEGWAALGRPESELYRGTRLQLALDRSAADAGALTPLESDFLAASETQHRAEADQARTAVATARRTNRRLRFLLGSTAGLLVLAVVTGTVALANRDEAIEQRSAARLEALVGTSMALRSTNRDAAALLAVEAYRRFPEDPRARSALLGTFTADPGFLGYRHVYGATRLDGAILPDGRALVVLDGRRAVVMDQETGETTPLLANLGTGEIRSATIGVSGNGRRVAVLAGGVLTVDDLADGRRVLGPIEVSAGAALALSSDGSLVATSDRTGHVAVRAVSDGDVVGTVPPDGTARVFARAAIAFSAGGELVVGSDGGLVRIVDAPSLRVEHEILGSAEATDAVVIPVREDLIVTGGSRRLMAVDPSSGAVLWDVALRSGSLDSCRNLVVSAATDRLYCGDPFGVIQERDLLTGGLTGRRFDVQRNDVGDLAITDGGRELVSFGAFDPVVSRWRLDGSGPVTDLLAEGHVAMDGFEPTGRLFVAARRPPDAVDFDAMTEFAVWDMTRNRAVTQLPRPLVGAGWVGPDTVRGIHSPTEEARSFDARTGRLVSSEPIPDEAENFWPGSARAVQYTTFATGEVWTVDTASGERVEPTIRVSGSVRWLATSPDGARVAVTAQRDPGTTELTVHDAGTGAIVAGPVTGVDTVAVTAGAVAGARGGSVTIYDPDTLEAVHDLPGARGEVNTLTFSADGATLLATSNDQTVSVYDTDSRIRLGDPIPADAPFIYPGHLHPSGEWVIVTVASGVALWRLDGETLRAAACEVAGRDLTRTEWTAYLDGFGPHRATCSQ